MGCITEAVLKKMTEAIPVIRTIRNIIRHKEVFDCGRRKDYEVATISVPLYSSVPEAVSVPYLYINSALKRKHNDLVGFLESNGYTGEECELIDNFSSDVAARNTLERMGYKHNGGELWEPPLCKEPDWDLCDMLRNKINSLELENSRLQEALMTAHDEAAQVRKVIIATNEKMKKALENYEN